MFTSDYYLSYVLPKFTAPCTLMSEVSCQQTTLDQAPKLNILCLHGFRQNANKLQVGNLLMLLVISPVRHVEEFTCPSNAKWFALNLTQ